LYPPCQKPRWLIKVQKRHCRGSLKSTTLRQDREETVIVHAILREREKPQYLIDYECKVECDDQILANVDFCYRVMCRVPQTFKEAMSSSKSEMWASAIKEEMDSLRKNDLTFTLTTLPKGKNAVRGQVGLCDQRKFR